MINYTGLRYKQQYQDIILKSLADRGGGRGTCASPPPPPQQHNQASNHISLTDGALQNHHPSPRTYR